MNFKFNADEQKVIDLIHKFGVNEIAPLAAEIDEQERFPEENRKRLAELGMMGICYPKEYGGAGKTGSRAFFTSCGYGEVICGRSGHKCDTPLCSACRI